MQISQKYKITLEQLLVIFNGFVHVIRLALKPPAAFLKPEVSKHPRFARILSLRILDLQG